MTLDKVMTLGKQALTITMLISAPCLAISLVLGLIISLFQATTQIHDQTLAFVPKIIGVMVGLLIFGGWMMKTLIDYTTRLIQNLPSLL